MNEFEQFRNGDVDNLFNRIGFFSDVHFADQAIRFGLKTDFLESKMQIRIDYIPLDGQYCKRMEQ